MSLASQLKTQTVCGLRGCQIAPKPAAASSPPAPTPPGTRAAQMPSHGRDFFFFLGVGFFFGGCFWVLVFFFSFPPPLLHLVPQRSLQAVVLADAFGWLPAVPRLGRDARAAIAFGSLDQQLPRGEVRAGNKAKPKGSGEREGFAQRFAHKPPVKALPWPHLSLLLEVNPGRFGRAGPGRLQWAAAPSRGHPHPAHPAHPAARPRLPAPLGTD